MKRNVFLRYITNFKHMILLIVVGMCGFICIDVNAEQYGDFEYEIMEDNTIEITDYLGESGVVVIPDQINGMDVVSIGNGALQSPWDGNPISSISVSSSNQYFSSMDGVLFDKNQTVLIACPRTKEGTYIIPDSVTEIGYTAFISCNKLTDIKIPDGVTRIGPGAFEGCYGITEIALPDSIMSIEYNAFYGCDGLTSIEIPDGVTYIDSQVFTKCESLENIVLPETVESISYNAFEECYSLKEIILPKSLQYIREYAFSGSGLVSIEIPENVETIEEDAFSCCFELESIHVNSLNPYYSSMDGILYNEDETEIIHYPFAKKGMMTIPSTLTELCGDVWDGFDNLEAVNVSNGNPDYSSVDGVLYNKSQTELVRCPGQMKGTVTIPNTVTKLTDRAFAECVNLQSVIMSDNVIEIGEACFAGCVSLSGITMSKNITRIGSRSFENCESLAQLVIPKGVSILDENFTWDILLTVEKDSYGETYAKAYGINYQYPDGTKPGSGNDENNENNGNNQSNNGGDDSVRKPQNLASDKTATEKKYPEVRVGDKVKASGAVYKITSKKKKTVTYVKPTNKKKSKVTIPATVKIYGKKYKVTVVGANAFKNNKKLKSIVLGKNIVKIEKNAFRNCKKLGLFQIKSTKLKSVGKGAIKNCPKINIKANKKKVKQYQRLFNKKGVY